MLTLNLQVERERVIDYHCHILWGLDDGPSTLEESLAMCRLAVADGISVVVATPHMLRRYQVSCDAINEKVEELNWALIDAGIPLAVYSGAEVAANPDIPLLLRRKELMTIGGAGKYLYIELANSFPELEIGKLLRDLAKDGVIPVITHPERNAQLQKRPALLADMVDMGALAQVTAMSITGDFGRRAREAARVFLKQKLVHMIASDGHSTKKRQPVLSRAVSQAARLVGETAAQAMVSGRFLKDSLG